MKKISFILLAILLVFTLASCAKQAECVHEYSTAFDAFCDKCGEERADDAFASDEASYAKTSFAEENHDDGTCSICGGSDDGDCTTPVLCTKCSNVLVEAKSHAFSDTWESDEESHWRTCTNAKCKVTDTKESHVSMARSVEPTDATCSVCEQAFSTANETIDLPTDHNH